jgi:hypothetical protein
MSRRSVRTLRRNQSRGERQDCLLRGLGAGGSGGVDKYRESLLHLATDRTLLKLHQFHAADAIFRATTDCDPRFHEPIVIPILLSGKPISSYGSLAQSLELVLRLSGDSRTRARITKCAFYHRVWRPRTRRLAQSSRALAQALPMLPGWPHRPMQRRRSTPRRTPPKPLRAASTSLQPVGFRPPPRYPVVPQIGKRGCCSGIRRPNKAGRRQPEASESATPCPANRWQMRKKAVAHYPAFRLQGILMIRNVRKW